MRACSRYVTAACCLRQAFVMHKKDVQQQQVALAAVLLARLPVLVYGHASCRHQLLVGGPWCISHAAPRACF